MPLARRASGLTGVLRRLIEIRSRILSSKEKLEASSEARLRTKLETRGNLVLTRFVFSGFRGPVS